MESNFFSKLNQSISKKESLLCVGLDPQFKINNEKDILKNLLDFGKKIIEQTSCFAACFKPNIAFYEIYGPDGLTALKKTLELIPEDTPFILDAKRADIGNTAKAYARSIFNYYKADATTVNPYMGKEAITPFIEYENKGIFILARTTNPGSNVIQLINVVDNNLKQEQLYIHIAREVSKWSKNIGLVVAGNDTEALKKIRDILTDIWILAPGIGVQGGTIENAIYNGIREDGSGILLNVSRGISQDSAPGEKANMIRKKINEARKSVKRSIIKPSFKEIKKKQLVIKIINNGCFKTGNFKLKSGIISPFYIDLRLLISNADLLYETAKMYVEILKKIDFKRIAGIPFAGIPIATCCAQIMKSPMIFPRLEKKSHGLGNKIEGNYKEGEKVVLIDDLITTGKSKFEAIDILEACDLKVKDLVVLVERGNSCRKELAGRGVTLHSCLTIDDFIDISFNEGIITQSERQKIEKFIGI